MGVSWIMEVISYCFAEDLADYYWYASDIFNGSRGVFVFGMFIMKKEVLQKMIRHLRKVSWVMEYPHDSTNSYFSSSQKIRKVVRKTSREETEASESIITESTFTEPWNESNNESDPAPRKLQVTFTGAGSEVENINLNALEPIKEVVEEPQRTASKKDVTSLDVPEKKLRALDVEKHNKF